MKTKIYITLLMILSNQLSGYKVEAQEIKDDTIYVSTTQQATLYFHDGITICDYSEESAYGRFNKRVENTMVSILAKNKNVEPATLKIKEGTRNHKFFLVYKEELLPEEVDHDWEDLKVLQKYVATRSAAKKKNHTAPVVTNSPAKVTVESGTQNSTVTLPQTNSPGTSNTQSKTDQGRDDYNSILLKAYALFKDKKYKEARDLYEEAASLKPEELIARKKIEEINEKLIEIQKEEEYRKKIGAADKAFLAKNYDEANGLYSLALSFKPGDPYAKRKMEECQLSITREITSKRSRENERAFQDNLLAGKKAFDEERFEDAKAAFSLASDLKPSDQYSKSQIKLIDNKLKDIQLKRDTEKLKLARETSYVEALANGNDAFNNGNHSVALVEYKKAKAIKDDAYLNEQIKKINQIIADSTQKVASTQARLEKERRDAEFYKTHVKKGDQAFELKRYTEAKSSYKQALNYKDEQYAKQRLIEIETIETKIGEENELKRKYASAVAKGKTVLANGDLLKARILFEEAHTYRPDEPFATAQLKTIYDKLDDLAKQKELEDKYDTCLSKAALAISTREYKNAQDYYKEAGQLKPKEAYPTKMIVYLEGVLLEEAERQKREEIAKQRRQIIDIKEKATQSIVDKNWKSALEGYKHILTLNPAKSDEDFAKQKISLIQIEIAKQDSIKAMQAAPVAVKPKTKRDKDQEKRDAIFAEAERKKEEERQAIIARQLIDLKKKKENTVVNALSNSVINNTVANSNLQSEPIPYSHTDLVKKYPAIDFDETPAGQTYDATDRKNRSQNFEVSNKFIIEKGNLNVYDSANYIKAICENISFNGTNSYLKLVIKNNGSADFLTGPLQLRLVKKNGKALELNQRFISNFPIVMPKKEFAIIYVTNASVNIEPTDTLVMEVNDRTKKTKLKINIPGNIYNTQKTAKL